MNKTEQPGGSWWQTVPGILTAVAGVLTALAGLLVVLHQVGLLSDMKKPAFVSSSSSNDTTAGHEAAAPATAAANEHANAGPVSKATNPTSNDHAPRYTVAFPSGSELILHSNRGEGTYSVLTAQVESRNTGKLSLKFSIRLTNKGPADTEFGSGLFRLLVDGVPRAPTSYFNDYVEARSAKEGDVMFEISDTSRTLVLSVDTGQEAGNIPIALKK